MKTKFIVLDTETTGKDPKDRIVQLAFIVKEAGSAPKIYNDYCKPELPVSFEAMSVNHITNEMLQDKPPCIKTQAFSALADLNAPENVLVIHNAPFDLAMLQKEGFENKMRLVDTYRCARHIFSEQNSHALQYLRYSLGLYKEETQNAKAHDALGDIFVLDLLVSRMVKALPAQTNKIDELIRLSQEPVRIRALNFGKHKGKELSELAKTDRDYLLWLLKSKDLDADLKHSLELVLND